MVGPTVNVSYIVGSDSAASILGLLSILYYNKPTPSCKYT